MRWFAAALSCAVFFGCAVGPDFRSPAAPEVDGYTSRPLPEKTVSSPAAGGEEQRFVMSKDIPEKWWALFQSEALDALIRQALRGSPTLAASKAALRQAQEYLIAGRGAYYPRVDAAASVARLKDPASASGLPAADTGPFTLYNASVGVSYTLDVFGGARREIESLKSQVDYQSFLLEGAYLTITSNIVTTAVQEASVRAQIEATKEIVAIQEKQLEVTERQFELGAVSRTDVLAQKAQLAQTKASFPLLDKRLDQTRHQLSVLVGKFPGTPGLPQFDFNGLTLPRELPVSLPSSLVRQRPDIRAAEAVLHSASAQVGVATANLYPQFTLTGSYGTQATSSGSLFGANSAFWQLGAGLLQPVFRGGELTALRRAAIAAYDAAEARYRETVLLAFEEVADVLRALDADAQVLKAQAEAEAAARETLSLAERQFSLGSVSYLDLLNAQRQYRLAKVALIQAQATRFADTAALFEALGGGWWNRDSADGTGRKG